MEKTFEARPVHTGEFAAPIQDYKRFMEFRGAEMKSENELVTIPGVGGRK